MMKNKLILLSLIITFSIPQFPTIAGKIDKVKEEYRERSQKKTKPEKKKFSSSNMDNNDENDSCSGMANCAGDIIDQIPEDDEETSSPCSGSKVVAKQKVDATDKPHPPEKKPSQEKTEKIAETDEKIHENDDTDPDSKKDFIIDISDIKPPKRKSYGNHCMSMPYYTTHPYADKESAFSFFSATDPDFEQATFLFLSAAIGHDTTSKTHYYQIGSDINFYRFFVGIYGTFLFEETSEKTNRLSIISIPLGIDILSFDGLILSLFMDLTNIPELTINEENEKGQFRVGFGFRFLWFPVKPLTVSLKYTHNTFSEIMYLNRLDFNLGVQLGHFNIAAGLLLLGFDFINPSEKISFTIPYLQASLWF